MTAVWTAGVCLVLAGVALAQPTFRIGPKVTWHGGESYMDVLDSTGRTIARVIYERFSVGPAVEASYGPVLGILTGRLDLAQVSISTSGIGGAGFSLFPMVGLDVLAEPPTQWRVKPYVWVGLRTAGYTQSPSIYEFHPDAETDWRGGLGVKVRLNSRIDLFAETQMYQRYNDWEGIDGSWDEPIMEAVGLVNAGIGARFALGK